MFKKKGEEIIRMGVLGSPARRIAQGAKYHFHTVKSPNVKRFKASYKKIDCNLHRNTALKVSMVHYYRTFNKPFNELLKLLLKTSGFFFSYSCSYWKIVSDLHQFPV